MDTIRLKNGADEALPLVSVIYNNLHLMVSEGGIHFYELVMKCRNRNHQFFGNAQEKLHALGFIQADGSIHDSIRNIVLSSVEGDGMNMSLVSPIKTEQI